MPDEEDTLHKLPAKKSSARTVWGIFHKIIGFAMVGIAWLQVYSGLTLYGEWFATKFDLRLGFCATAVAISGVTFLLSLYSVRIKQRSTVPLTVSF